jgi:glycosyltransferase involved in cell wall biosynthesis
MKVSVVMPVYNEEHTIQVIVQRVLKSLDKMMNDRIDSYELIIVDDGSQDGTKWQLKNHISHLEQVKIVYGLENKGKGFALKTGFQICSGDVTIIQDADLEYAPEEYPKLLDPILDQQADVVYGTRFQGGTTRILLFWHTVGNKFLTLLSNFLTDLNFSDMETGFKVFKTSIIQNMLLTSNRFGVEPEMTAKISKLKWIRIYEVPISYFGRTYDQGKKIGWKDGVSALWCILKFNLLTSLRRSYLYDSDHIKKLTGHESKYQKCTQHQSQNNFLMDKKNQDMNISVF